MAEDGLNVFDVYTFLQKQGSESVSEGVWCGAFADAGTLCCTVHKAAHGLWVELVSIAIHKKGGLRVVIYPGGYASSVFSQGCEDGLLADVNYPFFSSFAVYADAAFLQINRAGGEGTKFRYSEPGAEQ